jgi:hypothetical protein
MAWTLAELSKIETDVLRKSVIDTLLFEANAMELLPWETIGQLTTGVVRIQDLPSVGFRRINAGYTESTGHFEHKIEQVALLGGDIDTDKAIARAKNTIADARAIQQQLMLKAMAYEFNDKLINGNPVSDALEFKGLRTRVDDVYAEGYTGQKIDAACAGVGILNTSATSHTFLDKLDSLIYAIKSHKPDFLFMNSKMLLALRSLLRREKLLDTTKDMFDRIVDVYQGVRLVDIGVKADQTTEIITSTETSAGVDGASEHTSIYAVKFGIGDMTWGIQEYPLEVEDLGLMESRPVYRTRVDWPLGLATVDPRSIGRLYGVIPDASA